MSSPRNGFGLGAAEQRIRERELIDSAIELARTDDAAWRHLRTLLRNWASEDEEMRRELLGELTALGKGRRGNAKAPAWTNLMLVSLVKVWTAQGPTRMTLAGALLRVADEFPHQYPSSLQALKKRYYDALKDPEMRRIAGLE